MLHVSLRRAGLAGHPGAAELLLAAIEQAVGPSGTLLMVLGTDYPMDWVNQHPVEARAALLAGSTPFDYHGAPVLPEVGAFAEVFRRTPGTIVSDNPSGRFGARGQGAEALLREAPWHDYYGPDSPLERLAEKGGRILRIGADPETVTALHYAEYLAQLPGKRRTRWDYLLATPEGPRHVWTECLDDNEGIAAWDGEDYFALIVKGFIASGRARQGRVGMADSELIEAMDIVEHGARWMERNLSPHPRPG